MKKLTYLGFIVLSVHLSLQSSSTAYLPVLGNVHAVVTPLIVNRLNLTQAPVGAFFCGVCFVEQATKLAQK